MRRKCGCKFLPVKERLSRPFTQTFLDHRVRPESTTDCINSGMHSEQTAHAMMHVNSSSISSIPSRVPGCSVAGRLAWQALTPLTTH